jgi:HPt (histidine-containing phosphotransfer) domain-containing protein
MSQPEPPPHGAAPPPPAARLDAAAMLDVVDGNPALVAELARLFGEQSALHLAALRAAVAAADAPEIRRIGHALKGSAATLHGLRAAELGQRIESAGQRGDVATARATLSDLDSEVRALHDELAALARRLDGDEQGMRA